MRQETIIKTYLTFDELNDSQKKRVIEKNRDINVDTECWTDCVLEEYKSKLKSLGFYDIDFCWSGFWSQGDGASFTAKHERGNIYLIGRYYHENSMSIDSDDIELLDEAKSIARNLYRDLEKEYDYLTDDQQIIDTILANDYEFDSESLAIV